MLVTDIPTSASVVSAGVWTDPLAQTKYFVDPSDSTLASSRAWTDTEVAAYNQEQAGLGANRAALQTSLAAFVTTLTDDIGLAQSNAALVKDYTSLNGILASTTIAADFAANPATWVKALARFVKHTDKASIAEAKIALSLFADASTGQ